MTKLMKPGDLLLAPEGFQHELCLVLKTTPGSHRILVFNSARGKCESYRIEWVKKNCEVISETR